ncbi:MAG: lipid-A-disaccharide synthase [Magnetovibrionaceae bacterium]
MTEQDKRETLCIIAGEPSGDLLGARLIAGLEAMAPGRFRYVGVGGEAMAAEGHSSLFPMSDLSVMGLAEVLPRLPLLIRRIRETTQFVLETQPVAVITIDAPDFSFRVQKRLKKAGSQIPRIHYVAPTVWAWRPGRAKKCAAFLDHMLCLLPFEPPYFEAAGLKASFVGHPVLEGGAADGDGEAFRTRHGIASEAKLLCVLPGSRGGEIKPLLPIFGETVAQLAETIPNLHIAVPTLPHLKGRVQAAIDTWPVAVTLTTDKSEKFDAFNAADAALAASGTVGLELAVAGCPHVIGYRVNWLTAAIVRRLIKVRFAHLVNLIADKPVIPEFLQENCTPDALSSAISELLIGGRAAPQVDEAATALAQLRPEVATEGQILLATLRN